MMGEFPMYVLGVFNLLLLFTPFFGNEKGRVKPYAVNIFNRGMTSLSIGLTIRFFTFIGTVLPGIDSHCYDDNPGLMKPKPTTVYEIFMREPYGPKTNCGDLIFSGHVL